MHRYLVAAAFLSPLSLQASEFASLDFGGEVYLEVPRHWTVLDENMRNHLDTLSEAATRIANLPQSANENIILIAANAYTSLPTPSATLRVSLRRGSGLSQPEIRELAAWSSEELAEIVQPVAEQTRRAMIGVDGVSSAKLLGARVVTNRSLFRMFFEFEADTVSGSLISRTYLCPVGTKAVKLSTSYRRSEAALFQPVLEFVWQSLRAQ